MPPEAPQTAALSACIVDARATALARASRSSHTYLEILKSSAVIGASSVLTLAIGLVRTKALSLLLGPTGFGLLGIYGSIADLARSLAEMGINSSGVRQIAAAVGTGDANTIARTVVVLRRIAVVLGTIGAVLLLAFCRQIATMTFGSDDHAGAVALLSLAVLFRLVSDGQAALLQGMRRIADLARSTVAGALLGTVASLPVIYFLREDGVVPSLIAASAMAILTSWWYSRKVRIERPSLDMADVSKEAMSLLKLGVAFMSSGFLMMGSAYAVRIIILRQIGLDATGFYQAAWTIGGLYVGFVLQAMGADFYPRLVGVANDNAECNRVVNEQAHVSLLLAAPGVLATLTCAPLVIFLLYSAQFGPAVDILRWLCLGMALRVITWPMGFIIVAKGRQTIFFLTELAWTVVSVGLAWLLVQRFGAIGAGIAFFGSYVFHALMIYPIVRSLSDFRWSRENVKVGLLFVVFIGLVFTVLLALPALPATLVAAGATVAASIYSIRTLAGLIPAERVPRQLLAFLRRTRLAPASRGLK